MVGLSNINLENLDDLVRERGKMYIAQTKDDIKEIIINLAKEI